jgi:tight adherence protein B
VRAFEDAALEIEPEGACEIWMASTAGIALVSGALAPSLMPLTVALALISGPVALHVARGRARQRFIASLPRALEHIATGLRGGASMTETLVALSQERGPLAGDIRRLCARAALGAGLSEALARWPAERDVPSVRAVAGALAVASSVGGPAAGALDGLAESLRQRQGAAAEARALSAQARLSAIVVGGAPLAYLAFAAVLDSDSLHVLLATGAGRTCLVIGLALEVLGLLWMRRIVRAEEPA